MYKSRLQDWHPKTAANSHMVLSNSDLTYDLAKQGERVKKT